MQRKRHKPVFLSLDMEVTNLCNTGCGICPRERIGRELGIMELSMVDVVIEKLCGFRPHITISGMGDPLLHPRLPEVISRFKSAGQNIGIVLSIASIINCRDDMFLSLINSTPDHITISIPSLNPEVICKIYNGRVSRGQIIDRLNWIRWNVKGKITLRISSLTIDNYEFDSELVELAKRLKMQLWVSPIHSRGGNLGESEFYRRKDVIQNASCNLFVFHTFIDYRGRVLSCCHDLQGDTEFAHISDGIGEILRRKEEILNRSPPFDLCNRCDEPLRFVRLPDHLEYMSYRELFRRLKVYSKR